MFKKIKEFFTGKPAPVAEAPYKVEAPAGTEAAVITGANTEAVVVVPDAVAPAAVVEAPAEKPAKAAKPKKQPAKKPAAMKAKKPGKPKAPKSQAQ